MLRDGGPGHGQALGDLERFGVEPLVEGVDLLFSVHGRARQGPHRQVHRIARLHPHREVGGLLCIRRGGQPIQQAGRRDQKSQQWR